jgi:ADP-ribosyl-[dinitrogen reductase] hydrolase
VEGARRSVTDHAVVSLCRTGARFAHEVQRFAYLTDDDENSELDAVLADVLDDVAALRAQDPALAGALAGLTGVRGVLDWMKARGLESAEVDLVAQDEFDHDFLVRLGPGGRWLAFGVT